MTWTRLDEDFVDRPDLLDLSRSARLLHVEGMVWSNRHGTDGKIPAKVIRRLSDTEHLDAELDELEAAWLWLQAEDGSWQIEQWVEREHQERAADVALRKKANASRQEAFRRRRAMHQAGDHSECVAKYCAEIRGEKKRGSTGAASSPGKRRTTGPSTATCPHGGPAGHDTDGLPLCRQCEEEGQPGTPRSPQQETDDIFARAMARARAQEEASDPVTSTVEVVDVQVVRDDETSQESAWPSTV